ncbi:hypothetical protein CWI38_1113p0020 [Hamiltosporidium tvaerminnensis]|uniref:Uncharacterized protein n=1 Tax=Hamiltosporidium tvaerminnensis TaxID=1176355 RepID=A0A4Q9LVI4_9MICR|nr:hypothetical protein CWI38_1113p0020 [Hamiltosporidium tvaerminnensis]
MLYLCGIVGLKFDILIYDENECINGNSSNDKCDIINEMNEKCKYGIDRDVCIGNNTCDATEKNEKSKYVSDMDVCIGNNTCDETEKRTYVRAMDVCRDNEVCDAIKETEKCIYVSKSDAIMNYDTFKEYLKEKNILIENILVCNMEYPNKRFIEFELLERNNTNVFFFIGKVRKRDIEMFNGVLQEEFLNNSWENLFGEDFFKIMNFLMIFKAKKGKKNCKFLEEITYTFINGKYNNYFGNLLFSSDFGPFKIDNWLLINIFNSAYVLFSIKRNSCTEIFSNSSENSDTLNIRYNESNINDIELFICKDLFKFISGEYNGLKLSYFILFIFKSIKISTCTILKDVSEGLCNYYKFSIYFPENVESLFINTKYFYTEFLDFCMNFSFCRNIKKIYVKSEYFTDEICIILRKFLGLQKVIFNIQNMRYIDIDPILFFSIYRKLTYLEIKCVHIVDPIFPLSKIILSDSFELRIQCYEFVTCEDYNFRKKKRLLKNVLSNMNVEVMNFSINDLISSLKEFSNLNTIRVKNYGISKVCIISTETIDIIKKLNEISLYGFYICSDFFKCCIESRKIIQIRLISCLIEFTEKNLDLNESLNILAIQTCKINNCKYLLKNISKFKKLVCLEFNKCGLLKENIVCSNKDIEISNFQTINTKNDNSSDLIPSIKELKIIHTCLSLEYLHSNLNILYLSKISLEKVDLSLEDMKILNRFRFLKHIILIKINLKRNDIKDSNESIFLSNSVLNLNVIVFKNIVLTSRDIYCISKMKNLEHISFTNINFRKYNVSLRNISLRVMKNLKSIWIKKCDLLDEEYWYLVENFSGKTIYLYR